MRLRIVGIVFLVCLIVGCAAPPVTLTPTPIPAQTPTSPATIRITITGIVDKDTHQPVPDAILTFTRDNPDSTTTSETPALSFPITTRIPADGITSLWVLVRAPGYRDYNLVIRATQIRNKFIEFMVELEYIEPGKNTHSIL